MAPRIIAFRSALLALAAFAAVQPVPAAAAEHCCICSNGRQETVAVEEGQARQACVDFCLRQSIMDQKVTAEGVEAGSCESRASGPRSMLDGRPLLCLAYPTGDRSPLPFLH